jgi:hypothetical protein
MTYREIAETFQDLIWHQLQTMLDSSHEGAAWAYPRPRSASLSMSNQKPGKNCAAHSLEHMSASLPPRGTQTNAWAIGAVGCVLQIGNW